MFATARTLLRGSEKYPRCRPLCMASLACLIFLGLDAPPPSAPRMTFAGTSGSSSLAPVSPPAKVFAPARGGGVAEVMPSSRLSILDSAEAWKHLPTARIGFGSPLPVWARALAKTLPHTTAAMLELDYLHRTKSPLDAQLRGRLRWVAAHENHCRYSEVSAANDLRRAGLDEAAIRQLAGDLTELTPETRAALRFGQKLSRDGGSITDDEVAQLISWFGEGQVVAMTMLVAHASFLDRILLALELHREEGGPLPPLEARFTRLPLGASRAAPPRREPISRPTVQQIESVFERCDSRGQGKRLEEKLAGQRMRRCRIALPEVDRAAVNWGLVCRTYQPELADAWATCARAFSDEANQDPLFEHRIFWVITHDLGCFY